MKLASPLVPVLILYVARDCLRGPLIDLSRENETGQPARVKHCCSPSLRCRSRFTRSRWRLHLAFAHVRPTPGRPHLPSVPKHCCSLRQHLRQLRQLPGTQLGLRTWCWSAAQSNDPLRLRPVQPLVEQTRRWSVALKTSGTGDEADRRNHHVERSEHNTQTRDDTRKRSREVLRPPQPGWT
jgi:hypothetical protein